jgi:xanthosine utilization system XapX-like protein
MVELAPNPEPFTVSVNAAPPTCATEGLRLMMVGFAVAEEIVKVELLDKLPPVLTVTAAVPCVAMRLGPTAPIIWVVFAKVVGTGDPFHKIVELAANPEPFTLRLNPDPPACAVDGLMLLMVGVAGAMVNVKLLDTVPLALTVTVADPCVAMRLAATVPDS